MSEIVSDITTERRERELEQQKRESYNMLLSLVVCMREHAHYSTPPPERDKLTNLVYLENELVCLIELSEV